MRGRGHKGEAGGGVKVRGADGGGGEGGGGEGHTRMHYYCGRAHIDMMHYHCTKRALLLPHYAALLTPKHYAAAGHQASCRTAPAPGPPHRGSTPGSGDDHQPAIDNVLLGGRRRGHICVPLTAASTPAPTDHGATTS